MVKTLSFNSFKITLTAGNLPRALSAAQLYTTEWELYCGSSNSGSVYVGDYAVNSTSWIPRGAGTIHSFQAPRVEAEPTH
jgi:hypothetical protein